MMTEGPDAPGRRTAEADRLVWVIRGMAPGEFTRRFRDGLPTAALVRRPRSREGGADRPLAAAIRLARRQADLSQGELAERLGIRQSSVSQWERGATEPTGRRLVALIGELPGLAEILKELSGLQMVGGLEPDSSTEALSGQT